MTTADPRFGAAFATTSILPDGRVSAGKRLKDGHATSVFTDAQAPGNLTPRLRSKGLPIGLSVLPYSSRCRP
jgi:hypothetical protein